ncbi:MAG: BREX-1 system adenine-specific DNA-methyltransferase PglX [Desulfamplus sp.]|nr:BREX-1 system adenine-specific DNA-methyltransferase PglX [Desulfamplus sp.]
MKLPEHVDNIRKTIERIIKKDLALNESKRQSFAPILKNYTGETGSDEKAYQKLIDELTFTLFNRIAAIKVMEAANLFPPVITKEHEHGDRSFGHKAWLEINPDMRSQELEGLQEYITHAFNELAQTLPLYSSDYPYSLIPDSSLDLNEIIDAFNAIEKDQQAGGEDIWQNDDILGWLYESYNNAKKKEFKESGEKAEYDKVSLQSQVYTPRWVIQFLVENSLGKLYLEMFPESEIKSSYKIANAPATQERKPKPLTEIKLIDPACGSGNFLLYAFDLFYALYTDQIENYGADYDEDNISKLIIENNLHGIDLDDRAVQLAQLGLYIKARKKRRSVGNLKFKVVSSDFFLPDYEEVKEIFEYGYNLDKKQKELIPEIWGDLKYAYKFGSLIRLNEKSKARLKELVSKKEEGQLKLFSDEELGIVPKPVQQEFFFKDEIEDEKKFIAYFFTILKIAVEKYATSEGSTFLTSKTRDAITFLELLTTEYDVATANPPYTDSSDFGQELKIFIEDNYKKPYKFHTNLYAVFIKRCYEFVKDSGLIATVHPPTFMYIKTFEDVRKFILDKTHINLFIEWGYLGMFNPSARVDSALYILEKTKNKNEDSVFIKLNDLYETKRYDALFESYEQYLKGESHELLYTIPQSKLKIIKSFPFIYWISDEFRKKFGEKGFGEYFDAGGGLTSANNDRFLRFWWEVSLSTISKTLDDKKKWRLYVKGGSFNKWYGNIWTIVNWGNSGQEIRRFCDKKGKPRATLRSEKFYLKEGITYAKAGSKGASFRYMPPNTIIDSGSPGIYVRDYKNLNYGIAFLNSTLTIYILGCLNPTVSTQVGDVERFPFVIPLKSKEVLLDTISNSCIQIKKNLCSFSIVELTFSNSPIVFFSNQDIKLRMNSFFNYENHLLTQVLINEAVINEKIFEVYELTEHDKAMVLAKEGESIGGLPVSEEARTAYLSENLTTYFDNKGETDTDFVHLVPFVVDFINSLPVKEFTAEERETIESQFPTLYQSNNDLEEFCIRNKINPINVWYWFKQRSVIPKQRMNTLAMEFLADMIRAILMEDDDGIIPLVKNAGEKILIDRIEEKFMQKGFTMAQYSNFDSVLGRPLNEYLNKHFFAALSDHLNLFMYLPKTPFIWHLSSGQEQGFDCYIIIYKWSRDKLMRLRSVYIEHRERSLINRQSDLAENSSAEAQNEKDRIFRQLKEIESFKAKIDDLLASGYNPILDDGVGKNIAQLQKRKMIPYEVLNAGQLKKYLNADW